MAKRIKKIKTEIPDNQLVVDFRSLIVNPGWARLLEILDENIEVLERQIITKTDLGGMPITEQECDELRFKVGYLKEIQSLPEKQIEKKTYVPEVEVSADPYDR